MVVWGVLDRLLDERWLQVSAITGTSAFRQEKQVTLNEGESVEIGGYTLRYEGLEQRDTPHIAYLMARIGVFEGGRQVDTLRPEKRFYKKPEQPTTEVAIRSTLGSDLYLVLGAYDPDSRRITLLAYVNPLVMWIWIGGLIMAVGIVVLIGMFWLMRVLARTVESPAGPSR